jgi:hypothetical protein
MALKVEGVVDGGMDIEEALGPMPRTRSVSTEAPDSTRGQPHRRGGKPQQLDASVVG